MSKLKKIFYNRLHAILPWYVNGTLTPGESYRVARWLSADPQARAELENLRRLKAALAAQAEAQPAPTVCQHLMKRIAAERSTSRESARWTAGSYASGAVLAALVLVLLWLVVRPGVVLEWTVETRAPATFRIYRAPQGTQAFDLVSEVHARPGVSEYNYVDSRLLPGRAYTYRVEGLVPGGAPVLSQAITASSLTALPGQVLVLFASLIIGYSLAVFLQSWFIHHPGSKRKGACPA